MPPDAFHPDLRRVARWLPRAAVNRRTLGPARLGTRLLAKVPRQGVDVHAVGSISVRLHQPPQPGTSPRAALLWMHGGGFVMGSAAQDDAVCRHFATTLGIVVASVEYRLAPEHRFPVPVEDCHDALGWLARQTYVDPARIAIGGASAGGIGRGTGAAGAATR